MVGAKETGTAKIGASPNPLKTPLLTHFTPLPLGIGTALTPYKHTPPLMGYGAESDRYWSNGMSALYGNPPKTQGSSLPAFQSHFRSSELTRSIMYHDFRLTFHSNHRPLLYTVSKIDIGRKLHTFI